jgi:dihydroxyacetone kinase phosphoprotein-dependent L subunit
LARCEEKPEHGAKIRVIMQIFMVGNITGEQIYIYIYVEENMNYSDLKKAILAGANDLIGREEELSQLDGYVGDGDHGMTIKKGYLNVIKAITDENPQDPMSLMFSIGMALANTAGGACGPILSTFFMGMANPLSGKDTYTVADLAAMFDAGMKSVMDFGGAKPGERTMLDTLDPFIKSLQSSSTADVAAALDEAAKAAYVGAQATANMVAKRGRAKNLGERSIGYVDAGSMSMYYLLRAFADSLK